MYILNKYHNFLHILLHTHTLTGAGSRRTLTGTGVTAKAISPIVRRYCVFTHQHPSLDHFILHIRIGLLSAETVVLDLPFQIRLTPESTKR